VKPSLQLRLSQHLALTPQLQQSIRLLQLSTLELHQEVEQMLEQNPFLDVEEDSGPVFEPMVERSSPAEQAAEHESERAAESPFDGGDEIRPIDGAEFGTTDRDDWENGTEREDFDGIREMPGKTRTLNDADDFDERDRDAPTPTLEDHLRGQLSGLRLDPIDAAAVNVLIESLNADGYLADSLEDIAAQLSGRGQLLSPGDTAPAEREAERVAGSEGNGDAHAPCRCPPRRRSRREGQR
jgi:RNA polymerase sigma-54 factor